MVSNLASRIQQIHRFAEKTMDEAVVDGETDLLERVISNMYDLIMETATFICGYVRRSPLGMCHITRDAFRHVNIEQVRPQGRWFLQKIKIESERYWRILSD